MKKIKQPATVSEPKFEDRHTAKSFIVERKPDSASVGKDAAAKAANDIFEMFSGILHRIVDRIESGFTDGIATECSAVKFEDVLEPIQKAILAATPSGGGREVDTADKP